MHWRYLLVHKRTIKKREENKPMTYCWLLKYSNATSTIRSILGEDSTNRLLGNKKKLKNPDQKISGPEV